MATNISNFSAYGFHKLANGMRVYHQGGLDSYCGILNLMNFMRFKDNRSNCDCLGANDYRLFKLFNMRVVQKGLFPEWPFGGNGLNRPQFVATPREAIDIFKLPASVEIEHFPIAAVDSAFGLAAVREGKRDRLGHWVVLVGNHHLGDADIVPDGWNGVVLDSDRGYEFWRAGVHSEKRTRIKLSVTRDARTSVKWAECMYLFVAVTTPKRNGARAMPAH